MFKKTLIFAAAALAIYRLGKDNEKKNNPGWVNEKIKFTKDEDREGWIKFELASGRPVKRFRMDAKTLINAVDRAMEG